MKTQDFIASYPGDLRLAPYDLKASVVHIGMLVRQKIISRSDGRKIVRGLRAIERDVARGKGLPKAEEGGR